MLIRKGEPKTRIQQHSTSFHLKMAMAWLSTGDGCPKGQLMGVFPLVIPIVLVVVVVAVPLAFSSSLATR